MNYLITIPKMPSKWRSVKRFSLISILLILSLLPFQRTYAKYYSIVERAENIAYISSQYQFLSMTGSIPKPPINELLVREDRYADINGNCSSTYGTHTYDLGPYASQTYAFKDHHIKNYVVLGLNYFDRNIYPEFKVHISFNVQYKNGCTPLSQLTNLSLEVYYNPSKNKTHKDKDILELPISSLYFKIINITILITDLNNNPLTLNNGLQNIYLESRIEMDRYEEIPNILTTLQITSSNSDTLPVTISPISGAEEYELEWSYAYDDLSILITNIPYSFINNSTRITTKSNTYNIPLIYDRGYLIFRYRAVGVDILNHEKKIYSEWTIVNDAGSLARSVALNHTVFQLNGFEIYKNWQYTVTFAEEGKRKEVISYFDGSLRNRESLTKLNSMKPNLVIVGQTIYDYYGRPAVQVLPVPDLSHTTPDLYYRDHFNMNSSTSNPQPYTYKDFDFDQSIEKSITGKMSTTSGASKYYSSSNNNVNSEPDKFIPDAQGYPFTQVEYMDDNTNRIRRQSGVGPEHRLTGLDNTNTDKTGHETKYFYGTAAPEELYSLFGNEVGNFVHYKKNLVVDPNGQISVSYLDHEGRVIATGLAGVPANSGNLTELPGNGATATPITATLSDPSDVQLSDKEIKTVSTLTVSNQCDYIFKYDLTIGGLKPEECGNLCYDCVYDMEITIVDDNGLPVSGVDGDNLPVTTPIKVKVGTINYAKGDRTLHFNNNSKPILTVNFKIGTYKVIKVLTVNEDAAAQYLDTFLKETCNASILDINTYTNQYQCDIYCLSTCEQCRIAILAVDADLNGNSMINSGGNVDVDDLKIRLEFEKRCDDLCLTVNPCRVLREQIIEDLKPGGQYALFDIDDDGVISIPTNSGSILSSIPSLLAHIGDKTIFYEGLSRTLNQVNTLIINNDDILNKDNAFYQILIGEWDNINTDESWTDGTKRISYDGHNNMTFSELYDYVQHDDPTFYQILTAELNKTISDNSWTNTFLDHHPEYCYLKTCSDNGDFESSYDFDNRLLSTESAHGAMQNGYFNPINMDNNSCIQNNFALNTDDSDPLFTDGKGDYSNNAIHWDLFKNILCSIDRQVSLWELINQVRTERNLGGCNPALYQYTDYDWHLFRSLYLNAKQAFIKQYYFCTGSSCSCTSTVIIPTGKERRFILDYNTGFENSPAGFGSQVLTNKNTTTTYVGNNIINDCQTRCDDFADIWIEQLKGCKIFDIDEHEDLDNGVPPEDYEESLREMLINICKNGCNPNNPIGSNSCITAVQYGNSSIWVHNFKEALEAVLNNYNSTHNPDILIDTFCNDLLIDIPRPLDHNYFELVKPDHCFCDKLETMINAYYSQNTNNCELEEYVSQELGYNIDVFAAHCNCNSFESYDPTNKEDLDNQCAAYQNTGFFPVKSGDNCPNCLNCKNINDLWTAFKNDNTFVPAISSLPDINYFEVFTSYVNNTLNHNFTPMDLINFYYQNCPACVIEAGNVFSLIQKLADDNVLIENPNQIDIDNYSSYLNIFKARPKYLDVYREDDVLYLKFRTVLENEFCIIKLYFDGTEPSITTLNDISAIEFVDIYYYTSFYKIIAKVTIGPNVYYLNIEFGDCINLGNCTSSNLCYKPIIPYIKENICTDEIYCDYTTNVNATLDLQAALEKFKREFISKFKKHCLSALQETFTTTYEKSEYHYTLYYYDQAGNLIKTVPPAGVVAITDTAKIHQCKNYVAKKTGVLKVYPTHTMITNYKYNTLNQLVWQETPDGGITQFWYDCLGRLIFSQNAKQMPFYKYSYTLYDRLNRPSETGEVTYNPDDNILCVKVIVEESEPTDLMNPKIAGDPELQTCWFDHFGTQRFQVTATYYDKVADVFDPNLTIAKQNLRSRVAAVTYNDLIDNSSNTPATYEYATFYSYDIHGNVNEMNQENRYLPVYPTPPAHTDPINHRFKKIKYLYDLISGKVNEVKYQPGEPDQFYHRYSYDADNRITDVQTSADYVIWDQDARYQYYKHGPLSRTELGEHQVAGTDYAYTIQGWLKGVNSVKLNPLNDMGHDGQDVNLNPNLNFATDAFGFSLGYFFGDYKSIQTISTNNQFEASLSSSAATPVHSDLYNYLATKNLYNGNISYMATTIPESHSWSDLNTLVPQPMACGFQYDKLNRLVEMRTFANINNTGNYWEQSYANGIRPDYYNSFAYDPNGNITNLIRNGNYITGSTPEYLMDNLVYKYNFNTAGISPADFNNRLQEVDETVTGPTSYTNDIEDPAGTYTYDDIGNLKSESSEQIQEIKWNIYGKITDIIHITGSPLPDLEFRYDPMGNRICKIVKNKYIPENLKYWEYTWYVRDAQGNIMATYSTNYVERPNNEFLEIFKLEEQELYGSSRLGVRKPNLDLVKYPITATYNHSTGNLDNIVYQNSSPDIVIYTPTPGTYSRTLGQKNYEQTNHLGNVLVTLTDRKLPFMDGANFSCWNPDIQTITDYYPFGMMMPNRSYNSISESAGGSQTITAYSDNLSNGLGAWNNSGNISTALDNMNRLHVSGSFQYMYVYNNYSVIPGKEYTLELTADRGTATTVTVEVCDVNGIVIISGIVPNPSGTVTLNFIPTITTIQVRVVRSDPSGLVDFYLQNVILTYRDVITAIAFTDDFNSSIGSWTASGLTAGWDNSQRMLLTSSNSGEYVYNNFTVTQTGTYTLQMNVDCSTSTTWMVQVLVNGIPTSYSVSCPYTGIVVLPTFTISSTSTVEIRVLHDDNTACDFYVDDVLLTYQYDIIVPASSDDFSTSAGTWSPNNTSINAYWNAPPRMKVTGYNQTDYISKNVTVVANKAYTMSMDVDCGASSAVTVSVYEGTVQLVTTTINISHATVTLNFTPTTTTVQIRITRSDPNAGLRDIYIDNINVFYIDFYPFAWSNGGYRFGYQGSEKDNEISGNGNNYSTLFRELDVRICRWFALDPEIKKTPWESPYISMGNNPIIMIDVKGDIVNPFSRKEKRFLKKWINATFGEKSGFSSRMGKVKFNEKKYEKAKKNFSPEQLLLAERFKEVVTNKNYSTVFKLGTEVEVINKTGTTMIEVPNTITRFKDGVQVEVIDQNNPTKWKEADVYEGTIFTYAWGGVATQELNGNLCKNSAAVVDNNSQGKIFETDKAGNPLGFDAFSGTAHELLSHIYRCYKSNHGARNQKGQNDEAIDIENAARTIYGLPLNSGKKH